MIQKEPRYRFGSEDVVRTRRVGEFEFVQELPRRRFDWISITAAGAGSIAAAILVAETLKSGAVAQQASEVSANAKQLRQRAADRWTQPFRSIAGALD